MNNLTNILMSYASTKRFPKDTYPTRIYNLLKEQGYNPDLLKYIHITGSKGKGSLACSSFELLKRAGFKTGLFISPHIFDIRERFITDQGMISEEALLNLMKKFNELFKNNDLHFFEICLFLALVYFLDQGCEYVVLEVGVGGRFDPTNFCCPEVSLLGHISIEHKDFLGNTIEEIAYDKAGIIKKDIVALSVNQTPVVKKILKSQGKVYFIDDIVAITNIIYKDQGTSQFDLKITIHNRDIIIKNIILNRIGEAHIVNFVLAVAGIYYCIPEFSEGIVHYISQQKIPYRMDLVRGDVIIDTSHNGVSFDNLMISLSRMNWKNIVLYITILQGKELADIAEVLKNYKYLFLKVVFFDFESNIVKISNGKELHDLLKNDIQSEYVENIKDIILEENNKKVFSGSFYSVPLIIDLLNDQNQ